MGYLQLRADEQIPDCDAVFLDAGLQEEVACPDRLHAFFDASGKVCGMRMEGESGLDVDRIRPLLKVRISVLAIWYFGVD